MADYMDRYGFNQQQPQTSTAASGSLPFTPRIPATATTEAMVNDFIVTLEQCHNLLNRMFSIPVEGKTEDAPRQSLPTVAALTVMADLISSLRDRIDDVVSRVGRL